MSETRWRWWVGAGIVVVGAWLLAHGLARVIPVPDRLDVADSTVVEWADGGAAHVFLAPDDRWRMAADLERIDDDYVQALTALEDERFWWHPGVDPLAIIRAAASNAAAGEVVSGASTITMQLVRLLEPRPRTFASKVVEALRAIQLELRFSKRQILEAYLTYVSYGGNVEGIEAASHLYFDKSPTSLTGSEIATLLAVPQDPASRHPDPSNRRQLRNARDRIARRLVEAGALRRDDSGARISDETLLKRVRKQPVPPEMGELPREIPHAARWLRRRRSESGRLRSTLERSVQRRADKLVDARRAALNGQGIHNTSVVIVEHDSGAIRGLVGNFDFGDDRHAGQIPAFDVRRSTGSLLKPFIYLSAIERGLAAPSHLVPDVPTSFGDYRPRNFGGEYRGLVELETALSQSLNIPFVRLLQEIGVDAFLTDLRQYGVDRFRRTSDAYGLSVAVGALELRPLDIAELFAFLARDGRLGRLQARPSPDRAERTGERAVSPGAAWLTRRALRKRDRPDFPVRRQASNVPTGIHWKTGTSAHNRDAWSAGSGERYTAVVWLGNLDNERSPALVGAPAAGPLFFDILEALESKSEPSEPPDDLTDVEVCALSGHRPTEACTKTEEVSMPDSSVATAPCPYHVEREIDPTSGLAVSPACRDGTDYVTRSFVQIPARASLWLDGRLGSIPGPPAYRDGCRPGTSGDGPAVEHPPAGRSLALLPGMPREDQQVPFEARAANHGATLHWYVDGEFVGSSSSDERLWWTPEPGDHEIVVMDGSGRSASRDFRVRRPR